MSHLSKLREARKALEQSGREHQNAIYESIRYEMRCELQGKKPSSKMKKALNKTIDDLREAYLATDKAFKKLLG